MKILFAHNGYQHRGGEDTVVDAEIALLRAYGHTVELYRRHNDELAHMSRAVAAVSTIWSQRSVGEMKSACEIFRPDLIHAHNTFPLISPALYWMADRKQIPVVQTLHNFRLICPQAMFLREGKVCEDCLGRLPWRAVTRKCYRESVIQSVVAAGMLSAHRIIGTYNEKVTRYIALNTFCRDKFIEGGLPAERIRIKPNFVASGALPNWNSRRGGLFVGRLSTEKGLDVLVEAVTALKTVNINVIGSGPLDALAAESFGERYLGFRSLQDIMAQMHSALYLIVPSIWYENFPRTIVEAFSCGLPVFASRIGALANIIQDGVTGLLFNPGDATDLAAKIAWAELHPDEMLRMGQAAHAEYEAKYTPERNYQMLIEIYEDAIATAQGDRHVA
ncbi:MAG: glycosyltransferase [Burkholderiaceae bacterium]